MGHGLQFAICNKSAGWVDAKYLPVTRPGKHTKNYGKSQFLMGKTTISMAIFNSYFDKLPEGNWLVVAADPSEKWWSERPNIWEN